MLTAETISEEQIRELRDRAAMEGKWILVDFCSAALGSPPWTDWTPEYCRARCAELLNARGGK